MRHLPRYLILLGACLWANSALANGGGYSFGISLTGSVAPFQASGTENVQILEEQLDIRLRRTDAVVVVRYSMKNASNQEVRVRFGFPVEASGQPEWDVPSRDDPGYADYQRRRTAEAYQQLKGYAVTADGSPVKAEFKLEPFSRGLIKPFPGSDVLKNIEGWMVSEMTFSPAATVAVSISYAADYMNQGTYVSDDDQASARTFVYRLSTGAVWRGQILKGTINVQADGIPPDEVEFASPRGRFKREGDRWSWAFQDLKPTPADDITIRASPAYLEVGAYGEREKGSLSFIERAGAWGVSHRRFNATASSTLAPTKDHSYGAENVGVEMGTTSWCEGVPGNGVGEWIQLAPKSAVPMMGIGITPGLFNWKKRDLFKANGSPTRVEIVLNDEHRFVATLGDRLARQFVPVVGFTKPVSRVRITILEVRPGSKYEDTCISNVVLYDRLKQKPEMRGAR